MTILTLFINYFFITLLVISLVVYVHEMGHYLAARYYKFTVKTFSLGFGREIWGWTDKHGTRWKISKYPLGGYVVIDEENKPLFARSMVTLAGPAANFLFFIILMFCSYAVLGNPVMPKIVSGLSMHSQSIVAGIKIGDEIIQINGIDLPDDGRDVIKFINNLPSDRAELLIKRDGEFIEKIVNLTKIKDYNDFGVSFERRRIGMFVGTVGISLRGVNTVAGIKTNSVEHARAEIIKHFGKDVIINFGEKNDAEDIIIHPLSSLNPDLVKGYGVDDNVLYLLDKDILYHKPIPILDSIEMTFSLLWRVMVVNTGQIYQIITGTTNSQEIGGIVKVGEMTGKASTHINDNGGVSTIIKLIAILSVQIGFFNLLPFPVLDGGNLVFCAYEAIRKKSPNPKLKAYLNGIGIILLLWIIFITNMNNIIDVFLDRH